jgi:hypothetical protein
VCAGSYAQPKSELNSVRRDPSGCSLRALLSGLALVLGNVASAVKKAVNCMLEMGTGSAITSHSTFCVQGGSVVEPV